MLDFLDKQMHGAMAEILKHQTSGAETSKRLVSDILFEVNRRTKKLKEKKMIKRTSLRTVVMDRVRRSGKTKKQIKETGREI